MPDAAQAGACLNDGIERREGVAISKIDPALKVSIVKAIMPKHSLSKVALNWTDAELALLVEPCDDPGGTSAKGALALHENNWPTIIEARNAAVLTIGISLGTDGSHNQRLMHFSAADYVKLRETGNCADRGILSYLMSGQPDADICHDDQVRRRQIALVRVKLECASVKANGRI
jgi:hypothetical protein